jgi:hypothetical protein
MNNDSTEMFTSCQSVSITKFHESLASKVEVNIITVGRCHLMPNHVCLFSARQGLLHIQKSILNIVICNVLSYQEVQLISDVGNENHFCSSKQTYRKQHKVQVCDLQQATLSVPLV